VKLCLVFERDEVVVVRCVSGSEMGRFWGRGSCEPDTNFKVNGYFDVEVGEMGESGVISSLLFLNRMQKRRDRLQEQSKTSDRSSLHMIGLVLATRMTLFTGTSTSQPRLQPRVNVSLHAVNG